MQTWKRRLGSTPVLGHAILFIVRVRLATGYLFGRCSRLLKWLFTSNEITNFTYDLEDANRRYLAALISDVTSIEYDAALAYIEEIEQDSELRAHIVRATAESDWSVMADRTVRYGRRVGWYALIRILKPKTVIETGVDKGLGACVITAALKRNKAEGHDGQYFGTDINPDAGYLLSGDYASFGRVLFGDSIESLKDFDGKIDLFINDSDHSAEYEAKEYETIANSLSEHAVVLGDNSHCTDKLLKFSLQTNRHFVFFQEKPHQHWYPGAGIGISFKR